ncbi:M48 family metallopeptidase [Opitutae bacterium]|nr:M48 family metallopeptidase [Opitutae bacterium]
MGRFLVAFINMIDLAILLISLLVLRLCVFIILEQLNVKFLKLHAVNLPETVRGIMDEPTFAKSVEYTEAKSKFSSVSTIYDGLILTLIITLGILPYAYNYLSSLLGYSLLGQSLVFIITLFLLGLPNLPFNWWETFKLEERFGFNKSSLKLWISDQIKGLALGLIIGVPLIMGLMWIVTQMGDYWWLWAFVFLCLFQVVMIVLYPMFILPLFNKLEPLETGELKKRLLALGDRCGFESQTILVMDGSKRSGHSNAFFTGFGQFRRIVLYDTLIEKMEIKELEAVLAHEIGHYKCGHIPQRLFFSAFSTLLMFAFLGWLIQTKWIFESLGFSPELSSPFVPAFLVVSLFSGLFTFWLSPLDSLWSRKHEYEADAFAKNAMNEQDSLSNALRKLYKENLSNLMPHPIYSAFYYSHPTIVEREKALDKV